MQDFITIKTKQGDIRSHSHDGNNAYVPQYEFERGLGYDMIEGRDLGITACIDRLNGLIGGLYEFMSNDELNRSIWALTRSVYLLMSDNVRFNEHMGIETVFVVRSLHHESANCMVPFSYSIYYSPDGKASVDRFIMNALDDVSNDVDEFLNGVFVLDFGDC